MGISGKGAGSWALRWGPVVVWMALIFASSAMHARPSTPGLEAFRFDDKLQHAAAYAVLAALVWRALDRNRPIRLALCASILIASAYGGLDELHQALVPGREASLSDWSCDSFGAALAAVVLTQWRGGGAFGRRRREDLRGEGQETREP